MKSKHLVYCENETTGEVGILRELRSQFDYGKLTSTIAVVNISKPYRRVKWNAEKISINA